MSSQSEGKCDIVIYGLYDPIMNELRYIGKTSVALPKRLARHLRDRHRTHKTNWLRLLKRQGLKPIICELERTTTESWQEAERMSIAQHRAAGARLTNLESGGRGGHTVDAAVKEKMRQSQLRRLQELRGRFGGIAASPETRAKLSKNATGHSWNRGWHHSERTKLLLSKMVDRKKARALKLGFTTITAEGRQKLSEARRKSSPLFSLLDNQWRTKTNREIAGMVGSTSNNVNTYRWRHGKPKYKRV